MPEIRVSGLSLPTEPGANLLDVLQAAGLPVASSCRAGHCQTCLVRSDSPGVPAQARAGLSLSQQQAGWLLSCQCPVQADLSVELHDPARDGVPARVHSVDRLAPGILRLRLALQRPMRFRPGQHLSIWATDTLARPYSIASQSGDPWLEFHIREHRAGAMSQALGHMKPGDPVHLGAPGGALHYDLDWSDRPLLLLGRGTGLAPLQAIAREALSKGHEEHVDLWHWHSDADDGCYLAEALLELAAAFPKLRLHLRHEKQLDADLASLRPASRSAIALAAGAPGFVDRLRRPLFMAGLAGRQIIDEAFAMREAP